MKPVSPKCVFGRQCKSLGSTLYKCLDCGYFFHHLCASTRSDDPNRCGCNLVSKSPQLSPTESIVMSTPVPSLTPVAHDGPLSNRSKLSQPPPGHQPPILRFPSSMFNESSTQRTPSPPRTSPEESQQMSRQQEHRSQQHHRDLSKPAMKRQPGRSGGSKNMSADEVKRYFSLVEEILPAGGKEWKMVETRLNADYKGSRKAKYLAKKWNAWSNKARTKSEGILLTRTFIQLTSLISWQSLVSTNSPLTSFE